MIDRSGIIYVYEAVTPAGKTVTVPIEETPDNLEELVAARTSPVAHTAPVRTTPSIRPFNTSRTIGLGILALAVGGLFATNAMRIRLEVAYRTREAKLAIASITNPVKPLPPAAPVVFEPLRDASGKVITPVNTDFSVIIPKIGVNAPVVASVNPADTKAYSKALREGVAHSATSFTPDKNGTTYLFSHSTNYEWFVKDLNAIFYLVKDLTPGDTIVVYYKGVRYTYELKEKRIVNPKEVSYLVPEEGKKTLILQTCWPPGSTTQRLLLFADLIDENGEKI